MTMPPLHTQMFREHLQFRLVNHLNSMCWNAKNSARSGQLLASEGALAISVTCTGSFESERCLAVRQQDVAPVDRQSTWTATPPAVSAATEGAKNLVQSLKT